MQEVRASGFQPRETVIALPKDAIADFCARWRIDEFYLFGSILRTDFQVDSDVDVMVKFSHDHHWGFEIVDMKEELENIFDRISGHYHWRSYDKAIFRVSRKTFRRTLEKNGWNAQHPGPPVRQSRL